jgi:hypothetical protein
MSIPEAITLQPGYRKEVFFLDQSFWSSITGTTRAAWGLDIKLKVFDRDLTKITGSFIIEATGPLRIMNVKNKLIGQELRIVLISNSEKIFHRWITSILDVVTIEEQDASTAFYTYKITCEFTIPMAEEAWPPTPNPTNIPTSRIDAWWETC